MKDLETYSTLQCTIECSSIPATSTSISSSAMTMSSIQDSAQQCRGVAGVRKSYFAAPTTKTKKTSDSSTHLTNLLEKKSTSGGAQNQHDGGT